MDLQELRDKHHRTRGAKPKYPAKDGHKTCPMCAVEQPLDAFFGRVYCPPCEAQYRSDYYRRKNPNAKSKAEMLRIRAERAAAEHKASIARAYRALSKACVENRRARRRAHTLFGCADRRVRSLWFQVRRQTPEQRREAKRLANERARRQKGVLPRADHLNLVRNLRTKYTAHVDAWFLHLATVKKQAKLAKADAHVVAWRKSTRRSHLKDATTIKRNLYNAVKGWVRKRLRHAMPDGFCWARMFPYTPEDLAVHLERQFLPGMGWHNRSDWHIDHIKPISSFDIRHWDSAAWRECFALENMRPLWAADNMRKGPRIVSHHEKMCMIQT